MEDLAAALRAGAAGLYAAEAAVELLVDHRWWLGRDDFVHACVELDAARLGEAMAWVDWNSAVEVWRAYKGKESLRAIFAGDLPEAEVATLLDRWCTWAQRSRLPAFVKLGRTIRTHRHGILAAIRLGLSNGRVEGRNATIRLITRRAFGFHTAKAAAALVMLCCGPITLLLPHEK